MPVIPQTIEEFTAGDAASTGIEHELKRARLDYYLGLPKKQAAAFRLAEEKAGREAEAFDITMQDKALDIRGKIIALEDASVNRIGRLVDEGDKLDYNMASRNWDYVSKFITTLKGLTTEEKQAMIQAELPGMPSRARRAIAAINPSSRTLEEMKRDAVSALPPEDKAAYFDREISGFDPSIPTPPTTWLDKTATALFDQYEAVSPAWYDPFDRTELSETEKLLGLTEPKECTKYDHWQAAIVRWNNDWKERNADKLTAGKRARQSMAQSLRRQEGVARNTEMQETIESIGKLKDSTEALLSPTGVEIGRTGKDPLATTVPVDGKPSPSKKPPQGKGQPLTPEMRKAIAQYMKDVLGMSPHTPEFEVKGKELAKQHGWVVK